MLNSKNSAMGIIFPNSFDALVSGMVNERLMASLPFASRYRMIDFLLSGMSSCGIDNIAILPNSGYHSLMDHLGAGREWDLVRKNGGLNIFPPFSQNGLKVSAGRLGFLAGIIPFLKDQKEKYVVMCDSNIAASFDFEAMVKAHAESGADITIAYNEQALPKSFLNSRDVEKDFYYSLTLEDGRVKKIYVNSTDAGIQNFSMNIFVIDRELLIKLVSDAAGKGLVHFTRDVILNELDNLNVQGYKFTGYVARICGITSYFDENMKLLDDYNLNALFAAPVYTKVRDDNPTRYITGSKAKNVMVADGCVIEGEIENCILFRGVKVAKGAKVKNCILMQDTVIEAGADIEYLITDKNVTITAGKVMKGIDTYPVYIEKGLTL